MNRVRARMLVLAGVLAMTAIAGVPAAFGQTAPALGGWVLKSSAAPVSMVFNSPSTGIPASPTGELHLARTIAHNDTGTGYGLASVLWPGPVAANAGPLISQEVPAGVKQGFRDGGAPEEFVQIFDTLFPLLPTIPRYEVRSESFHPQGPDEQRSGAQGVAMDTTARHGRTEALASMGGASITGLIDAAAIASTSRSVVEGTQALSEARAEIEHLSVLGGVVTVEQLTTTVSAISDGTAATLEGTLTFSGLRIGDQTASLDGDGFHAFGQNGGPDDEQLNELGATLSERGITVKVTQAIDSQQGAAASRSIDGILIVFEAGAIKPFIEQLPEQVQQRIRQYIEIDQVVVIAIGSASASAAAAPPLPAFVPSVITPPGSPPQLIPVLVPGQPIPVPGGNGTQVAPRSQPPSFAIRPVASVAVPAGLAALVALLGLLGSFGLSNVADRATTMRAEVGCPLGGA